MGSTNVALCFTRWGSAGLSHRAFRVLLFMANTSHDQDRDGMRARRYWGDVDALAEALGFTPDDSARRQVRKCLTELRRVDAIRNTRTAHRGSRAEYELLLDLWTTPAKEDRNGPAAGAATRTKEDRNGPRKEDRNGPRKEDRNGPRKEDRNGPECRTETVPNVGPKRSPLGTTEEQQRSTGGTTSPVPLPHQRTDRPVDNFYALAEGF